MKRKRFYNSLALTALLLAGTVVAPAQNNAVPVGSVSPAPDIVKLKAKWTKAFEDARRDFQNNNDRESAEFTGKILASLDQPGCMAPAAMAANVERIKQQVRDLVRRAALESAARLNWAQCAAVFPIRDDAQPAHPNHKTGGTPGPGGLVLYFSFDKSDEGGVVHDESGASNDGHVFGAQWVPDGKFGGAYQFRITNVTDRIVIPNSDTLNPNYITVSAWVKAADRDGFFNRIVDKHCDNGYCLDLGGDFNGKAPRGKLQWELGIGYMGSDRILDDGQWHFVAGTYDGKTMRCYVDGSEKNRSLKNPGPLLKNSWDLCIGNSVVEYTDGAFAAFDGLIDEVRIYNRALSADEIKLLATATQARVEVGPAPPADNNAKPDAAERLKKVKSLYDQGLISKEDYDKKVKEIVDGL